MFGPENMSPAEYNELLTDFKNDPLEKEAFELGEKWKQEMREKYPTPESVAWHYRQGYYDLTEMKQIYTEEEIKRLFDECKKLEAAGE